LQVTNYDDISFAALSHFPDSEGHRNGDQTDSSKKGAVFVCARQETIQEETSEETSQETDALQRIAVLSE
jgi:hypothetical protein